MQSCTLDHLTDHLATAVLRVVQVCGPVTKADIVLNLGNKWNIRFNDFPELRSVVAAALQSGLQAGLMIEQNSRYTVCTGYDHQHRALSSSLMGLNKTSNMKASGLMNRKKINMKPEALTDSESEAEDATNQGTFLDTIINISRTIFDMLV